MEYIGFDYESIYCKDEGQYWFYAAYNFVDDSGEKWTGKSPVYRQRDTDFYDLHTDAMKVDSALRAGAKWEEVCGKFRQAW